MDKLNKLNELKQLYQRSSKHSKYQLLPTNLRKILNENDLEIHSRYENERLEFILSSVNFTDKTILDIGANTGFFCFEFLNNGAKFVEAFEGNKEHAAFIQKAAEILNLEDKIKIINNYFSFNKPIQHFDVVLLLNVLHHIGDDFGDKGISVEKAKKEIIQNINYFIDKTRFLILQLGFNWKGDKALSLFEHGTKEEMIDFITNGVSENWNISFVAVPVRIENKIVYQLLDDSNIKRDDSLGEFLNRPIFVLESKKRFRDSEWIGIKKD